MHLTRFSGFHCSFMASVWVDASLTMGASDLLLFICCTWLLLPIGADSMPLLWQLDNETGPRCLSQSMTNIAAWCSSSQQSVHDTCCAQSQGILFHVLHLGHRKCSFISGRASVDLCLLVTDWLRCIAIVDYTDFPLLSDFIVPNLEPWRLTWQFHGTQCTCMSHHNNCCETCDISHDTSGPDTPFVRPSLTFSLVFTLLIFYHSFSDFFLQPQLCDIYVTNPTKSSSFDYAYSCTCVTFQNNLCLTPNFFQQTLESHAYRPSFDHRVVFCSPDERLTTDCVDDQDLRQCFPYMSTPPDVDFRVTLHPA